MSATNGAAYEPKPGSLPFRVLAHLASLGPHVELSTSALAEQLNVAVGLIQPTLLAAIEHGVLFRRQKDGHPRSPWFWSLDEHESGVGTVPVTIDRQYPKKPMGRPPRDRAKVEPVIPVFITPAPAVNERPKPEVAADSAPSERIVDGPRGKLRIALWSDGELIIERAGESMQFSADEVREIVRYLERMAEGDAA